MTRLHVPAPVGFLVINFEVSVSLSKPWKGHLANFRVVDDLLRRFIDIQEVPVQEPVHGSLPRKMSNSSKRLNGTGTNEYIISGCTITDGDALAANNLPAFWADPHFRLNWPNRTLEYHVIQAAKRYPNNLLTGKTKRHVKAVHAETGRLVGYVRWVLPTACNFDASVWPEAVVPAVSEDDEAFFRRLASIADWRTGDAADGPSKISPVQEAENEILSKKTYIRK